VDRGLVSRPRLGPLRPAADGHVRLQPLHPGRNGGGQQRDRQRRPDALDTKKGERRGAERPGDDQRRFQRGPGECGGQAPGLRAQEPSARPSREGGLQENRGTAPATAARDHSGRKKELRFTVPFLFGNLEFPENIDFAFPPTPTVAKGKTRFEKRGASMSRRRNT